MNYIIVKNNCAKKYVLSVDEYMEYVNNQYNNCIYLQEPINNEQLNDNKYKDGMYIIKCNDNKIQIVEKTTLLLKGLIYNSRQVNINVKDNWMLIKNEIIDDEKDIIDDELNEIYNKLLNNYNHIQHILDETTMLEYKEFNIDTILDYSSILFISDNNETSIDSQHDIIEYILDNNNINDEELYIYDTNINTKNISQEKFFNGQFINDLEADIFTNSKKQIIVIELNDNIIKSTIFQKLFNNRETYNLTIIGVINPLNINTKLDFDMVIMYDIINSVCSNSNIYRTIYINTIKNINYNVFLQNINVSNRYVIYNN